MWYIEVAEENGHNLIFEFLDNIIIFKRGKDCLLPTPVNNDLSKGRWKIEKNDETIFLIIEVPGHKLDGKYKLEYKLDYQRKLLQLYLTNEDKLIICSKALHNFKTDRDL